MANLLCNISTKQIESLRDYFLTLQAMNRALDLVKSTGRTGGRAEALDLAVAKHDTALAALVATFENGK